MLNDPLVKSVAELK